MKNYWLFVIGALIAGTLVGWGYNEAYWGSRDGRFGQMTSNGEVNALNVMDVVSKRYTRSLAKAEMLTETTHDFGAMAPNTEGQHTFVIKNVGEEPMELELGATTCKCTLGELANGEDTMRLMPGEETDIEMKWTVMPGKSEFRQHAQLRTNDPANVAIDLFITGLVIAEIETEPKEITFGNVASGDAFEFSVHIFCYLPHGIKNVSNSFSSESLTELTEFEVEEVDPASIQDSVHKDAKQAFKVTARVKPGMRQGAVATDYYFEFHKLDENGDLVDEDENDEGPDNFWLTTRTVGGIVGSLRMLEGPKLKALSGGSFVYNFGNLDSSDSTTGKTFVTLKGSEKDTTNLTVGEVYPEGVIKATLGKPIGRGSMKLFPLTLEVLVGDEPIDLQGKGGDDFGYVWIESDNPKVGRMRVAVKVAADARP